MGLRFRKSIKICKGIKVNFAKTGASLSLGGRGFSTNFGSSGVKQTVGIPGTGVSFRNNLGTSSHKKASIKKHKKHFNQKISFLLRMDGDGHIQIQDSNGIPITNETVLRKIRATEAYRLKKQELDSQRQVLLQQTYDESIAQNEQFICIHRLSQSVEKESLFRDVLNDLTPIVYEIQPFDTPCPEEAEIRSLLMEEAKKNVKGNLFQRGSKRKKFVEDNIKERYSQAVSEWEAAKERFSKWQQEKAAEENGRFEKEYEEQKAYLEGLIIGNPDAIEKGIESWLSSCEFPLDISVDYSLFLEKQTVFLDIDLPEIEEMPSKEIVRLESGNLREKNKTQTTIRQEYVKFVLGLAIFISSHIFNISPYIKRVVASGYTQRRDKIGDIKNDYTYSVQFLRERFENSHLCNVDPLTFCSGFENRMNLTTTLIMKAIKPFEEGDITE